MAITGSTDIGDGLLIVTVDHDPTVTATDAPAGSIIIWNGVWYRKQDTGVTTNVDQDDPGLKVKFDATVAPTATDDSASGYAVGSHWIDVTANKAYTCVDSTASSAIWLEVTFPNPLDSVQFNTALSKPGHSEGLVYWDKDENALVAYNDEADVTQQIGREFYRRVRNETGGTITNGSVVYQSGVEVGGEGRPLIDLADASDGAKENVIGVATHDIENNTYGYITVLGDVNDVDTSAFTAGAVLYLSPTTPGTLTETRPTADEYVVEVATAEIIHASTGRLNVNITNFGRLADFQIISTNNHWNSGLDINEASVPDGTVDYTTGDYYHGGSLITITPGGNYDLSALYLASLSDGEKAYVAIHVDETGAIESSLGSISSSSSSVQFAPVPAGDVCLAQVLIHRSSGSLQAIKNGVIVDCRSLSDPNVIDELVKVSFDDTTQKYLEDAVVAGTGITVTTLNPGANETLEVSADAHTIASHSDTTATGAELNTLTDGSNADALHTHAGGSSVFGDGYQTEENTAAAGTNSITWEQRDRLTTPSLPSGTYRIEASWLSRSSSTGGDRVFRMQVNDVTNLWNGEEFREESKDSGTDQRYGATMVDMYTGSGVLNIDLDYRSNTGSTHTVEWSRITIWRVS